MKFYGRYSGNTPVVIHEVANGIIETNNMCIDKIVQGLRDGFGRSWKIWAGSVKNEPMMVGKM